MVHIHVFHNTVFTVTVFYKRLSVQGDLLGKSKLCYKRGTIRNNRNWYFLEHSEKVVTIAKMFDINMNIHTHPAGAFSGQTARSISKITSN